MTFQAYIDNVKSKTGKTPEDFTRLAADKGLNKHGDIVKWLKADFDLGHGHATAIAGVVLKQGTPRPGADDKLTTLFAGARAPWRAPFEALIERVSSWGAEAAPGGTYINLLRAGKKFAIVQPSSAARLDVGIKLKGEPAQGRFEEAGAWNAMVTHRVRIEDPGQIDEDLYAWLKRAFDAAAAPTR
jgi:hypothetical protein